jgi:hydrophobic/amphiphilic exporter-1 (mainly G- bacteria), HAE1 family
MCWAVAEEKLTFTCGPMPWRPWASRQIKLPPRFEMKIKILPVGALRSLTQERVIQVQSRVKRPEDFANIIVARKGTTPIRLSQVATVNDGAQEITNMALYNGERTLVLTVQKAQDANTIEVVDGLMATLKELRKQIPCGHAS